jgi:hypothetical protein
MDGVDSDHAALLMNFEPDCNALLSNKSDREKEKLPKQKIEIHILLTDGKSNFQIKISSDLDSLDPFTIQEHLMQKLFKTLKSTLLNLSQK